MPYKNAEERRKKRKENYAKDPEKYRTQWKTSKYKKKQEYDDKERLRTIKRLYNLDADDYYKMLVEQNNLCAICGKPEKWKNRNGDIRPLSVDHCHSTGKVRSLLCVKCNALLGHAEDDIVILEEAISYLKRHGELT